jgi:hypothetical protein
MFPGTLSPIVLISELNVLVEPNIISVILLHTSFPMEKPMIVNRNLVAIVNAFKFSNKDTKSFSSNETYLYLLKNLININIPYACQQA